MRHTIHRTLVALAVAGLPLSGCQEKSAYTKVEPAHVEHKEGEEISKLTLTEKAMERLDVQTTPVLEGAANGPDGSEGAPARVVVPYSAIQYVAKGDAFVYTSPQPRTFIRVPVDVESIEGGQAVLKSGPPPGTQVVSVGVAELFGTEFGVGH
jgi:hypothetical protein